MSGGCGVICGGCGRENRVTAVGPGDVSEIECRCCGAVMTEPTVRVAAVIYLSERVADGMRVSPEDLDQAVALAAERGAELALAAGDDGEADDGTGSAGIPLSSRAMGPEAGTPASAPARGTMPSAAHSATVPAVGRSSSRAVAKRRAAQQARRAKRAAAARRHARRSRG